MKILVVKELPQGQQPGETIDVTDAEGEALILVGAATRADDPATDPTRRRYKRRDLEADA